LKTFKEAKLSYSEVFNENGEQILDSDGTGILEEIRKGETVYTVFENSLNTSIFVIDGIGDTIYIRTDKMAEPKIGYSEFYSKLTSILRYPLSARFTGEEATIYVQFNVNEDGSLSNFECHDKSVPKFENKTIKRLSKHSNKKTSFKKQRTTCAKWREKSYFQRKL